MPPKLTNQSLPIPLNQSCHSFPCRTFHSTAFKMQNYSSTRSALHAKPGLLRQRPRQRKAGLEGPQPLAGLSQHTLSVCFQSLHWIRFRVLIPGPYRLPGLHVPRAQFLVSGLESHSPRSPSPGRRLSRSHLSIILFSESDSSGNLARLGFNWARAEDRTHWDFRKDSGTGLREE